MELASFLPLFPLYLIPFNFLFIYDTTAAWRLYRLSFPIEAVFIEWINIFTVCRILDGATAAADRSHGGSR